MWTSLGRTIGDFVEERLTSPLISSFVLAWIAVNYKFFVLLFSKNTATATFKLIETHCFPDWYARIGYGFLLPLFFALVYLYVVPIPARAVYGHWRKNLRKTDEIKLEHELNKRLTVEESREIKKRVNELEIEIDTSAQLVRNLRTELQTQYSSAVDVNKVKAELTDTQTRLANAVQEKNDAIGRLAPLQSQFEVLQKLQEDNRRRLRGNLAEAAEMSRLVFNDLLNLKPYSQLKNDLRTLAHHGPAKVEHMVDKLEQFGGMVEHELRAAHEQVRAAIKEIGGVQDEPDFWGKDSAALSKDPGN